MSDVKLSIIIVNYKSRNLLKNCLRGIFASQTQAAFEVIVVDNDSRDGSQLMVKKYFPQVRYIASGENVGFGRANNLAMAQAAGAYFLILNPDTCVFPKQFDGMLEYLERHPNIGVLGGQLLNPDRSIQVSCYNAPKWYTPLTRRTFLGKLPFGRRENARFLMSDFDRKSVREVDWLQGSFMLMPRRVVSEVGGFDDRYFMYFEDIDLCRRVREAGYTVVYYPHAQFVHYHRRESDGGGIIQSLRRKTGRYHLMSWLKYLLKWRFV